MKGTSIIILIVFFFSSCHQNPEVKLLTIKTLEDFPSASAIEFYKDRIYLFGDDAAVLLITDKEYQRIDTVRFIADTTYRISKSTKPDTESAAIVMQEDEAELYALGSFSTRERGKLFSFPLRNPRNFMQEDLYPLVKKLSGRELNIEGLAITGDLMIMANRANAAQPMNQ